MQLRDALSGDAALESGHFSFQIRLPYIKGVVHTVDFHALFAELGPQSGDGSLIDFPIDPK